MCAHIGSCLALMDPDGQTTRTPQTYSYGAGRDRTVCPRHHLRTGSFGCEARRVAPRVAGAWVYRDAAGHCQNQTRLPSGPPRFAFGARRRRQRRISGARSGGGRRALRRSRGARRLRFNRLGLAERPRGRPVGADRRPGGAQCGESGTGRCESGCQRRAESASHGRTRAGARRCAGRCREEGARPRAADERLSQTGGGGRRGGEAVRSRRRGCRSGGRLQRGAHGGNRGTGCGDGRVEQCGRGAAGVGAGDSGCGLAPA